MSARRWSALSTALSWIVVSILGAVEGIYGRTQYLADWISYLTVSHAVSDLDWKGIFDPMWNPGYPALVALARSVFPRTVTGEWYAIFVLNWLIFLCAYAAFRYLIRQAIEFYDPSLARFARKPAVTWAGACIFLVFGLCFDHVSRVSPDLVTTTLFLLSTAQILRLAIRPSMKNAALLGLFLGIGCWAKGVFLAFAFFFFAAFMLTSLRRRLPTRVFATAVATFCLLWVPNVALTSWAYGQFTLGVSGPLNYAFHVNEMPHWTNWQGGPSQFGQPIHASRQLLNDLPVFEFGTPFQSTYPPFNNMAYWYQGYHSFFDLRNQLIAIGRSIYFLFWIVAFHPFLYALVAITLVIACKREWRRSFVRVSRRYWPILLPALLGVASYLIVHVEDRYLSCFLMLFSLLPFAPLLDQDFRGKRTLAACVLALVVAGAGAELMLSEGHTFNAALHGRDFHSDEQWKLAQALQSYGLRSGDTVAVVSGNFRNMRSSWAYVSGLRIVAEFGSLPWRVQPASRMYFEHISEQADKDFAQVFWSLQPSQRERVMRAFEATGVRAVISLESPDSISDPGWTRVGETDSWIYLFGPQAPEPEAMAVEEATNQ